MCELLVVRSPKEIDPTKTEAFRWDHHNWRLDKTNKVVDLLSKAFIVRIHAVFVTDIPGYDYSEGYGKGKSTLTPAEVIGPSEDSFDQDAGYITIDDTGDCLIFLDSGVLHLQATNNNDDQSSIHMKLIQE